MSKLDHYANKYERFRLEREDGVLQLTLHTDGGPFVFDAVAHRDFASAFADIAEDVENKVVILTGTGDRFCADFDYGGFAEHFNQDRTGCGWRPGRRAGGCSPRSWTSRSR